MKIFNWVHRKLNGQQPSSVSLHQHKGEVKLSHFKAQMEEKLMAKSGDDHVDTEALLGWREGLLAIGTLGLYTDNNNPHPDDFIMNPNFSSFPDERNSVFDYPNDSFKDDEYFDATMLIEQMLVEAEDDENPLLVYNNNNHEINKEVAELEMTDEPAEVAADDIRNKESGGVKAAGDRTTLADLFKAETTNTTTTAVSNKCTVGVSILKENEEMCKQKKFTNSISGKLVKKLIPSHDANPVKKINHMMRKMMKRKIHPELRLRQKSATGILLENKVNEIQANEGMALLLQSEQLVLVN